jgi:preprotein translocase subunit SecE
MAENKKEVSTAAVKKVDTKLGFGGRTKKWFREMRSELKKVVWPTRKQMINNTLVSVGVMLVSALGVWVFDLIASNLVNGLLKLIG